MKSTLHKRWWFIGICLLAGVISFRHLWLWLPEHRYQQMITQTSLRSALEKDSPDALRTVAASNGYKFQIFKDGKLQETSSSSLPHLLLLHQPASAPGVLTASLSEQLNNSRPYEYSSGLHRYIFFSTSAGRYTYVVYGKVF